MHTFTSRIALLGALTLLATGTLADAATIVFQPSNQDAFIDGGQPNHIFGRGGTGARLFVQPAPNLKVAHPKRRRALVRFDIPLPPFSTINSATLDIYEQAQPNDPPRTHSVHRMTSDWAQTTVKWGATGGPSAIAGATATQSVGSKACVGGGNTGAACASNSECPGGTCTAKGYKSFDVKTDVQAFVNTPATNFGWMVKDETPTSVCVGGTNAVVACSTNSECPGGTCAAPLSVCTGGGNAGAACSVSSQCPGGSCPAALSLCVGGANTGAACSVSSQCPGGTCTVGEVGGTNEEVGYSSREDIPGTGDPEWRPRLTIDYTAPACVTNADCTNASPCTTNPHCTAGHCAVDPVNCDDGNACTDDFCDPQSGCVHPLANCDDGFSCTIDGCDPNTLGCTHTPVPSVCTHNGCQTGTCVADENNDDLDPVTGCQVTSVAADGAACNTDGIDCTSDQCLAGECTHPNATFGTSCTADGNPCTDDICDGSGVCGVNNTAACNDNNGCTQTDQCSGGTCVGSNPVICTALDQCHDVGTCSPGTGLCSNPVKGNGTGCDDGDACTQTDQCTGGACVGGNPVVCTALDQCHDVGTCDTGTGLCSNPPKPDSTGCDDGNACTLADACTGGQCIGNPQTCGDGIVQPLCNEECDDPSPNANCTSQCRFICGPTPQADCRLPVIAGKGLLVVKNKTPDKKDVLVWKWVKGAATTPLELGTPLTSTGYTICVYDASANPQPLLLAMAPPAGTCAGKPCWQSVKNGFKYKDKDLTPNGLSFLLEKAGAAAAAKLIVRGKGANLGAPGLPLTPTVTVQLKKNDDPGVCWQSKFSTTIKNLPDQFKAHAD